MQPADSSMNPMTQKPIPEDMKTPSHRIGGPAAEYAGTPSGTEPEKSAPRTPQPAGKAAGGRKNPLPAAAFLIIAALAVSLTGISAILMFTKFSPMKGLFGGEFVGIQNIQRVVESAFFLTCLQNSAILRVLQIAAGLIFALPLTAWAAAGKKPGTVLTKACLCLVPMCLPAISTSYLCIKLLPRDFLVDVSRIRLTFALASMPQTAGFFGFCGGLFAYLARRGVGGGARQGLAAALLISALTMLSPDMDTVYLLINDLTTRAMQTFDIHAYRAGLMNAQYSLSSAVSVMKFVFQAALAVIPAILLNRIAKRDDTRIDLPDEKKNGFVFAAAHLIWIGIAAAAVAACFIMTTSVDNAADAADAAMAVMQDASVTHAALISLIMTLISGAVIGLLAYGFACFGRMRRSGPGAAGLMFASMGGFIVAEYMIVRNAGFINTIYAVVLHHLFDPRVCAVAILMAVVLRMAPERSEKMLLPAMMLLCASIAWGNYSAALLTVNNMNLYPLPLMMRQILLQGSVAASAENMTREALIYQQSIVHIINVFVAVPALLFALGGAAACISAFRKKQ